jgi:hypothetical protein
MPPQQAYPQQGGYQHGGYAPQQPQMQPQMGGYPPQQQQQQQQQQGGYAPQGYGQQMPPQQMGGYPPQGMRPGATTWWHDDTPPRRHARARARPT